MGWTFWGRPAGEEEAGYYELAPYMFGTGSPDATKYLRGDGSWMDPVVDGRLSITDYGATGDGITDSTAAIQSAIDAMSNGDRLGWPAGRYRITDTLDWGSLRGIRISGTGGQSANEGTYVGAAIVSEVSSDPTFAFNVGGDLVHEGPILEYLNFIDNTSSADAVLVSIEDMNYWTIRNCTFRSKNPSSTTDGGTGVYVARDSGQDNSWGMIDQCRFIGLDYGIYGTGSFGHVINGGNFVSHSGQIGLYLDDGCQHWRLFGPKFDGPGKGVHLDGAFYNQFLSCAFESCSVGIDIDDPNNGAGRGNQNIIVGGVWVNNTTGVDIASGVYGTTFLAPSLTDPVNGLDEDNIIFAYGGNTKIFRPNHTFTDGNRPAASAYAAGSYIYNTSDNAPNWSDGTNWRDAAGNVT